MRNSSILGALAKSFFVAAVALPGCADLAASDRPAQPLAQVGGAAEPFSFFVTSQRALQELSGSQHGFGGDLRFGETGENAGLRGADKICAAIAEDSMPGAGKKTWRAFLSATKGGPNGDPVHAIDRVGDGPWYDRVGRLVAQDRTDLAQMRPRNADPRIVDDLPNEDGIPNRAPNGSAVDNHHVLTGSDGQGRLYGNDPRVTCADWTTSRRDPADAPRVGLSWPRRVAFPGGGFPGGGFPGGGFPGGSRTPDGRFPGGFRGADGGFNPFGGAMGEHWISALDEAGCAPGGNIINAILPDERDPTVGSGGGYGAIYCFALTP